MPKTAIPSSPSDERGAALIWSLVFVVVTSGMVISHSIFMAAARRDRDARYGQVAMARTIAKSGAVDVLSWFQRQNTQPVSSFSPLFDPEGDPPSFDTIDPTVGLVREFRIRGNLWGRYEARSGEVTDISQQRNQSTPGTVWAIGLRSYVYRVLDADSPFDEAPNRVVAQSTMSTEMRGVPLSLPTDAAVNTQDPSKMTVHKNVIIDGKGSPGLAFGNEPVRKNPDEEVDDASVDANDDQGVTFMPIVPPSDPTMDVLATITGSPATLRVNTMAVDTEKVFGMRSDEVQAFSDIVWMPAWGELPKNTRGKLITIPGDIRLDGITINEATVVVRGDLKVVGTKPVVINGVLYVAGNATIPENFTLTGSLVVRGDLVLGSETATSTVEISFSDKLVQFLQDSLQAYRLRRSAASDV